MKAGIFLPENLRVENIWHGVADDIYKHAKMEVHKTHPKKFPLFLETLQFISSLYLEEKEPYSLTSWISDQMLHGLSWKDFIVYPSFVNQAYSCNIALHPNVVDKYLEFIKVIRFKYIDRKGCNLVFSTGNFGEIHNTNIEWRKAEPGELDLSQLTG